MSLRVAPKGVRRRAGWMLAALLVLGGCQDDGAGFAGAETPDEPKTHLTAQEVADMLSTGTVPDINWVKWYIDGQSEEIFPLEIRTPEEIRAEERERGRLLANGARVPPGTMILTEWDRKVYEALERVLRDLSGEPQDEEAVRTR